jgi:hypothetical protein
VIRVTSDTGSVINGASIESVGVLCLQTYSYWREINTKLTISAPCADGLVLRFVTRRFDIA